MDLFFRLGLMVCSGCVGGVGGVGVRRNGVYFFFGEFLELGIRI